MDALHYASLSDVCRRIKSGELTSTAVTEHVLDRIAALEPELHSFAMVLGKTALATAERCDQERASGKPLGALHGVPLAIKDLLFTAGVPTASGTVVMKDFVPDENATVVDRLVRAGAVLIGKTQLTEGAYGMHHPDVVPPVNPWNAERWTGVSSSGSGVAVAAGMAYGALGSDTGGSIRFPCASCALVGIKPTYGRVSRHGAFPLAGSLDHIGPMTRTVEDAGRLLGVIAGKDERDPSSVSDPVPNYGAFHADALPGLRIGVDWDYVGTGVEDAIVEVIRESLAVFESLGADVVDVRVPASHRTLVRGWGVTTGVECARAHADYFPAQRRLYGPALTALIELGLSASEDDYQTLERVRAEFRTDLDALLSDVDVMIAPCMTGLPPLLDTVGATVQDDDARADFITFTAPFDYSGHPTITLPAGLAPGRLPLAFQLIGRTLAEPTLIRAGSAFESTLGFTDRALD